METRSEATDKPLPARAQRSHDAIVAAATTEFLDRGFDRTTMDEIAVAAAVSKQTVYAHFASKEVLFLAVIRTATGAGTDKAQAGIDFDAVVIDPERTLLDFAQRQLRVVSDPRLLKLRRLVVAEVPRFPELGQALHAAGPARAIDALQRLFARFRDQRLLTIADPAGDAALFNWLLMGEPLNNASLFGDDSYPRGGAIEAHARRVVSLFIAARGPGSD
ncbi:MAG TPA: TetR/AcrR family transcriptional regulator [Sphingomonas sp.]